MLGRACWVLQAAYSILGKLLWPIYQVTSKAARDLLQEWALMIIESKKSCTLPSAGWKTREADDEIQSSSKA